MDIRARLYNANGEDREVRLAPAIVRKLTNEHLLWVDVSQPDQAGVRKLGRTLGFPAHVTAGLEVASDVPRLVRGPDAILLTILTLNEEPAVLNPVVIDLVAGRNMVVTIHSEDVDSIAAFEEEVEGEVTLGKLDAGTFLAALVDTVLGSFHRSVDAIEREIDELDEQVLRGNEGSGFLAHIVRLRRRTAAIRQLLVAQRESFSPLTRPDFELHEELGPPWPALMDRLEKTIESVERARQLLVGSSDLYIARAAQRSGEVMRVLTIISAVLLPAIVLAGVMGMNFELGFFDNATNFWIVVAAMLALATLILVVARTRHWI
jgi:magnesium transporter